MASRFEKNFTNKGYLMKYEKLPLYSSLKNQVLQFSIALQEIEPKIWRRIHVGQVNILEVSTTTPSQLPIHISILTSILSK